jgi:hypothetical protein
MKVSMIRSHFKAALTLAIILSYAMPAGSTSARGAEWRKFTIPDTELSVDVPVSIFTKDAGATDEGSGRKFFTRDHRADLTIKSVPNPENDTPAVFLEKMQPPARIQYKRITRRFFAVSSIRNGRTWYNRCNQARGFMNCVLINYPSEEDRQWDAVVTRISLSLAK